jgi:hypothetical protein
MAMFLYPLYTILHAFLLIWAFQLYSQSHELGLIVLILVISAIAYDNFIVSIGRLVGQSKKLLDLSQPRFICHVLLTPFSVFAAFSLCAQGHLEWANRPLNLFLVWTLVLVLVIAEVSTYYKKFDPKAVWFQGTLRYTNSAYKMLPIPSIITTVLVGLIGFYIWQQLSLPWLLIGSIVMFIGGAIPQYLAGPIICSGVEVILIFGFCMTAAQIQSGI